MKQEGFILNYIVFQCKSHVPKGNEESVENILKLHFDRGIKYRVAVSDLTYVRTVNSWNYMCVLVDLFN